MTENLQSENITLGIRRIAVEAEIVLACKTCSAPGFYINHWSIKQSWPKCYDPTLAPGERVDVGPVCPQCRAPRPRRIPHGEVSSSMPRWMWDLILAFKRVLVAMIRFTRRTHGALSWK